MGTVQKSSWNAVSPILLCTVDNCPLASHRQNNGEKHFYSFADLKLIIGLGRLAGITRSL
jgi:hypothetical protein